MFANNRIMAFGRRWPVFAACVLLWRWFATSAANVFFPSPTTIARAARGLWFDGPATRLFLGSGVGRDVLPGIARLLGGLALAGTVGIVAGITLGLVPVLADHAGALLAFMRAVPPVMLVPVFLVLFHIGTSMQVATIAFGSVWPVLLNSVDGARSVDPTKMATARAFRISRPRWIISVVLPTASPKIFAGPRISLAFALILMVVSELVGSTDGLGYQIASAEQTFNYSTMWAGTVLISVVGYTLNRLLVTVENRALSWHRGSMRLLEG
jgi:ABC-type nitrate/sulfonate/bicarbonate transport system permease component